MGIGLCASTARAESWRVHGTAAGAHALSGHQQTEFGLGGAVLGAIEYGFTPELGLFGELGWVFLSQGDAPDDPSLARMDSASALSGAFGLRVRPFAQSYTGASAGAEGLWLGAGLGLANSDGLNRLFLDAHLGYDFFVAPGKLGLGPTVGLWHMSQPDDNVRPSDANLLLVGLHVVYEFAELSRAAPSDRDRDGMVDELDKCPDDPEDKDGFEDADGCPDDDNDKDGVEDKRDDCPLDPEDKDGFEDGDGCPESDNDKDGLADASDKCPDEPEDKDGFEDEDGCPDEDNDQDGVTDAKDLCPDEPETKNNYADHDGCPDEEQVRVVGDKIVLDDRVHFRTNSHIIRGVSYPLLERLSKLVSEHPEYTHISIEGHADVRGPEEFNKDLSQRRAESVLEFMVKNGVARERLSAKGFGSERPLVDATNEHAHLLNRRVEFVVTRKVKQPMTLDTEALPTEPSEPAGPTDAPSAEPEGAGE